MWKTEHMIERQHICAQITVLLDQLPSLEALHTAKAILASSIPSTSSVLTVLREITPNISSFLSLQDCLSLSQTCKTTRIWQKRVLLYKTNSLLEPFVKNPKELRDIMNQTGSIVSGSSALWLICGFPKEWSAGDLDMYCAKGQGHILVKYFRTQGYQVIPPPVIETGGLGSSFFSTSGLHSATKLERKGRKVNILESPTDSALHPLTRFHSSVVMNYITSSEIGVLYPTLTLRNIAIVQTKTSQRGGHWKQKYETQRGFSIYKYHPMATSKVCPKRLRFIGDVHSLVAAFDEPATLDPNQNISWNFRESSQYHLLCSPARCILAGYHDSTLLRTWFEMAARMSYRRVRVGVSNTFQLS
ncbi:hypothetical protein M408DRAFT_234538 [Serendipita vermifera MAFF 305830]|uniref:F-box domain-containing protein n=1 Tax=Serendipita vermifera MAFF 305830 TaxID=933852 RepID=A0A0C2WCY2_SERVB|nr:hypothetical protein M408DRAFT_234538 [Serendipita vermifera MAFF 305830]